MKNTAWRRNYNRLLDTTGAVSYYFHFYTDTYKACTEFWVRFFFLFCFVFIHDTCMIGGLYYYFIYFYLAICNSLSAYSILDTLSYHNFNVVTNINRLSFSLGLSLFTCMHMFQRGFSFMLPRDHKSNGQFWRSFKLFIWGIVHFILSYGLFFERDIQIYHWLFFCTFFIIFIRERRCCYFVLSISTLWLISAHGQ